MIAKNIILVLCLIWFGYLHTLLICGRKFGFKTPGNMIAKNIILVLCLIWFGYLHTLLICGWNFRFFEQLPMPHKIYFLYVWIH